MEQQKQIEEMAKVIAEVQYLGGLEQKVAERLYNADYRKQSEVAEEIIEIIDKALAEHEGLRQALNILIKKKYVKE